MRCCLKKILNMKVMYAMFKISKKYEQIPKTIRLPEHLVKKLENTAKENNISFNCLVIQSIEYAFQHIDTESENNEKENV